MALKRDFKGIGAWSSLLRAYYNYLFVEGNTLYQ